MGETKEKTNVRLIAQKTNFSSDYARLLCRALARSGHIKFENDLCHLLKRGRSRFENNDPAIESTAVVAPVVERFAFTTGQANVTLLTDEPVVASPASDRDDEEENQGEDTSEDKDKPVSSDEELDNALADLEPSAKKVENEEADKPDLSAEVSAQAEELEKETETAEEPKIESNAGKEEVRSEAKIEEEKLHKPGGWSIKKIVNWFVEEK